MWRDEESFAAETCMRPEGDYVDLDCPLVLGDWTRSLGVTVDELVRAVDAVGTSAGKVYDYLWRARQRTFH